MNEQCSCPMSKLFLVRKINCPRLCSGPPAPASSKAAHPFFCFICSCFWVRFCLNKGFQGQEREEKTHKNTGFWKPLVWWESTEHVSRKTSQSLIVGPQTSQLIPLSSCLSASPMRIRVTFPSPTSWSADRNQIKTFQTTGAVQLFVVWFLGLGVLGNQGNRCFKTIGMKLSEKGGGKSIHEQRVWPLLEGVLALILGSDAFFFPIYLLVLWVE